MTCHTAGSLLDDYVDGQLDPDSTKELEDHLQGCSGCRRELATTKRLKELLQRAKPPPPGEDYWGETTRLILARTVESEPQSEALGAIDRARRTRTAFVRSILSLAASIAILVAAVLVGENRDRSPASFEVAGTVQPVYFTQALAERLDFGDGIYTTDDQRRLARGMLLMGPPGTPGRLAVIIEMGRVSP